MTVSLKKEEFPTFEKGRPFFSEVTAEKLTRLVQLDKKYRPISSDTIRVEQTGDGSVIHLAQGVGSRGTASAHPYKGFNASVTTTAKVVIQYGTHNSVVPTIDGTPLSVVLSNNVLTLGGSDTLVWIQLDLDGSYAITSASIHSGTTLPTSDDETAYQTLFAVDITTNDSGNEVVAVAQSVSGSQAYQYCGGSHLFGLV